MTPEGKVKDIVKKVLDCYGDDVYRFMPVQMGYGATALDFLCCFYGRFFAVETKALGEKPSSKQELVIEEMNNAGAWVFVVDGSPESLRALLRFLYKASPDRDAPSRLSTAAKKVSEWLARNRPTANKATSSRKKTPAQDGSTSEPNTKPSRGSAASAETKKRVKKRAQPGAT